MMLDIIVALRDLHASGSAHGHLSPSCFKGKAGPARGLEIVSPFEIECIITPLFTCIFADEFFQD